jgi:hypothetical protein
MKLSKSYKRCHFLANAERDDKTECDKSSDFIAIRACEAACKHHKDLLSGEESCETIEFVISRKDFQQLLKKATKITREK